MAKFLKKDGGWQDVSAASDLTGNLPIANGGTGAESASDARDNLGVPTYPLSGSGDPTGTPGTYNGQIYWDTSGLILYIYNAGDGKWYGTTMSGVIVTP